MYSAYHLANKVWAEQKKIGGTRQPVCVQAVVCVYVNKLVKQNKAKQTAVVTINRHTVACHQRSSAFDSQLLVHQYSKDNRVIIANVVHAAGYILVPISTVRRSTLIKGYCCVVPGTVGQ